MSRCIAGEDKAYPANWWRRFGEAPPTGITYATLKTLHRLPFRLGLRMMHYQFTTYRGVFSPLDQLRNTSEEIGHEVFYQSYQYYCTVLLLQSS